MAERALDPDRFEMRSFEESRQADHGVLAQELQRDGGIVEIDASVAQGGEGRGGQRVGVHLEPEPERGPWAEPVADAAEAAAGDGLVQAEHAAPEVFVSEGVVAESLAAFLNQLFGALESFVVRRPRFRSGLAEVDALGSSRGRKGKAEEHHPAEQGEEQGSPRGRTHDDTSR
jgi:hypothetical protein